jgi:ribosome maturation factor RimP
VTAAAEVGDEPTFFVGAHAAAGREVQPVPSHDEIERRVETALAGVLPRVDLLELTVLAAQGGMLRLVVDHPDGVTHEVCADVTRVLERAGLLDEYGVEVWSPGPEPPLRRPEHFRRALGRRVRIRVEGEDGARSVSGTLVDADDAAVRVEAAGGVVEIPLARVRRAVAAEEVGAG